MCLILHIDTAVENASVCLAEEGKTIMLHENKSQKDHAAWIHVAIKQLLHNTGYTVQQLQAVAISAGPGSYTGLRVGLSTAKGLCYALKIPLLSIGTLRIMAYAAMQANTIENAEALLCPMIDARRMEVFTALYNQKLKEVLSPQACILTNHSFSEFLRNHPIIFFGNGSKKLQQVINHPNAIYLAAEHNASDMVQLAHMAYLKKEFSDLAYAEPLYVKAFYTPARKLS